MTELKCPKCGKNSMIFIKTPRGPAYKCLSCGYIKGG